jgi:hypothetical protein
MNEDGQPDLAVGAQAADFEDREDSGAIYVVFVPRQAPPLRPPPPPLRCLVPAVKGKTLARAKALLKAQLCGIGRITRVAGKAKAGIVLSQRPRAGTSLRPNAKVSLVVSRGRR